MKFLQGLARSISRQMKRRISSIRHWTIDQHRKSSIASKRNKTMKNITTCNSSINIMQTISMIPYMKKLSAKMIKFNDSMTLESVKSSFQMESDALFGLMVIVSFTLLTMTSNKSLLEDKRLCISSRKSEQLSPPMQMECRHSDLLIIRLKNTIQTEARR